MYGKIIVNKTVSPKGKVMGIKEVFKTGINPSSKTGRRFFKSKSLMVNVKIIINIIENKKY